MYKPTKQTVYVFLISLPISIGIILLKGYLILEPLFSIPAIPFSIISVLLISAALTFAYEVRKRRTNKEPDKSKDMETIKNFLRHPVILILLFMGINVLCGVLLSEYIQDEIVPLNVIFDGLKGLIIGISTVLIFRKLY